MKLLKLFTNTLLATLIFVLVPVVLFVFITSRTSAFFGIRSFVVLTGSMKPALPVGTMVFTAPEKSYGVGDIITFHRGNISVTHRIYDISGGKFITKGDANSAPDPELVSVSEVIGRDVAIVPFVGRFTGFIKTPLGFGLILGIPTLLFVLFEAFQIKKEWEKVIEKRIKAKILNINPVHSFDI